MELTSSFLDLLQHFAPVFTAPTHHTFAADRLRPGPLAAASLYHRGHLLLRSRRHRPLGTVPSLLQPCHLGHRYPLHVPRQAGRHHPRTGGHLLGRPIPRAHFTGLPCAIRTAADDGTVRPEARNTVLSV